MNMKKFLLLVLGIVAGFAAFAQSPVLPHEVFVEGGSHHVQGIVCDKDAGRMYFSFTDTFIVTDMEGKVLGSVNRIQGHLGAMTFDSESRKVYASLECKDDVIGKGLSDFAKGRSMFYIAIIDVDKVKHVGMDSENNEAFKIVCVKDATKDYHAKVKVQDGTELEHRYGCSGIDGVAIAPKIGKKKGRNYLYVAYGIYKDENRQDNDCQVLLRYKMKKLDKYAGTVKFGEFYSKGPSRPLDKYFVFTGNTNWGVQNMAYDPSLKKMFMFVYKGSKQVFPNYDTFIFDIASKPVKRHVDGVSYDKKKHPMIGSPENPVGGVRFKYGSTGVSPLGEGLFFISENGRNPETGLQNCRARHYKWDGMTFTPVSD